MGVDDRDWMRTRSIYGWIRPEYAHADTRKPPINTHTKAIARSYPTPRPRTLRRRPLKGLVVLGAFVTGLAVIPGWYRFDATYLHPGPKPPTFVYARARIWVPPARYGHVKVIPVRILVAAR